MDIHSPLPFGFDPLIAEAKRRSRRRRVYLLAALVGAAAVAVGGVIALRVPAPSSREGSGGGSNVSSVAPCTKLALGNAVSAAVRGEGFSARLVNLKGGFSCSKGWAAAFANVGSGNVSVTETFVFHSEHGVWRRQLDRARVCDAHEVPHAIYWNACQTN